MNPRYSAEEKQAILMDVINRMKEYTGPTITQVCGSVDEQTGELLGTGTFFDLRDSLYLVTAQHVALELFTEVGFGARKYTSGLCHSVGTSNPMMRILSPWYSLAPPKDIAVTRLERVVIENTGVVPVRAHQIALNTDSLNNDVYFVHGWPGAQSRFTAFFERGVMSRSLPYGGWLDSSRWPDFDHSIHFAISYPPDEIIDESRMPITLPHPGGLSGAVVWKTNKAGTGPEWTPEMSRVVGVAHRFDQESRSLVVTRIEVINGFLLHVLRSDYAYFRWNERGRPLWDDLDDWIAAENAVSDLQ